MLSITLATQLKETGLTWTPAQRDFFAIPDREMDDQVFVINFMMVGVGILRGQPVVTFHGAAESPLDYLYLSEAVWLPTETQLRTILEEYLVGEPSPTLSLNSTPDGYRCQIQFRGETLSFEGFGVDEVYGLALLHILKNTNVTRET
jgi:hypothetical protein